MYSDKTKVEGCEVRIEMSKENPVKLALAALLAVGSLGYVVVTFFEIDTEQLTGVSMSSLWDSFSSENDETLLSFETEIPLPESSQSVKIDTPPPEPELNLNTGGTLQELEDTLLEDKLWEEGIARSREPGVRSGAAVLEALAEIASWSPVEEGYSPEKLSMYLRNPKIWVRLSAFAFALKAGALSDKQIVTMARLIELKTLANPAQVRRFLTRYERTDPELYGVLMDRLVYRKAPTSNDPPAPQEEEYSQDAS